MTVFQPVNMMGPAHRGPEIQKLAQTAAANVMRRQRMKALLKVGSQHAPAGAGQPFRSTMQPRPMAMKSSLPGGGLPGGVRGSMLAGVSAPFTPDPGGYDFASLPDPNDPSQGMGATQPSPPSPAGSAVNDFTGAPILTPGSAPPPGTPASAGTYMGGDTPNNGAWGQQSNGLIPIGGGLFYDPATDAIHGGR